MRRRRAIVIATLTTLGFAVGLPATTSALPATASAQGAAVLQSSSPLATPSNRVAASPPRESIDFNVGLQPSDPAAAVAFAQEVTDPSNSSYRHFLTPAQWESRFSPSPAALSAVTSWLRAQSITVEGV